MFQVGDVINFPANLAPARFVKYVVDRVEPLESGDTLYHCHRPEGTEYGQQLARAFPPTTLSETDYKTRLAYVRRGRI